MDAKILSYRRGRHTEYTDQFIVSLEGVSTKEEATKFVGKKISWETPGKHVIRGKIANTHGNSGMHDLFYGNIAQEVAAASGIPVLLIKPDDTTAPFKLRHILVPLDNESIHDKALPSAEALAKAYGAELDLLCVIPTLGTLSGEQAAVSNMLPATAIAYLDIAEEIAEEHFQGHLDAFKKAGIPATAEIARGDPAPVIAKNAEKIKADLILFGTHGRAGMEAFWNRSVAASVARRTGVPLLLIPLSE